MNQESGNKVFFHHALRVMEDVCTGCIHCMRVCPTSAIRIERGKAVISANKCIDCGECAEACPVNAIIVEQDDFSNLDRFQNRIALIPGVFFGQFPEKFSTGEIYFALKKIGFSHVFEVENAVNFVLEAYGEDKLQAGNEWKISSFCPAVVRLIQVRFPSLIDRIIRVKPPIDLAALYIREKMSKLNPGVKTGIFYITPCAAKIASVKSPVGDSISPVDGVINMKFLFNLVNRELFKPDLQEELNLDQEMLSSEGILWSLTGGEAGLQQGRSLAIDGIHNVSDFLEKIENEDYNSLGFLELRACDQGCAGGLLISGNHFLTAERLRKRSALYPPVESKNLYGRYRPADYSLGEIYPRPIDPLDLELSLSLKKMSVEREMMKKLPGIDCGACGTPGCNSLAEDIARGKSEISSCIFLRNIIEKSGEMDSRSADEILFKIWGQKKFETEKSNKNENK